MTAVVATRAGSAFEDVLLTMDVVDEIRHHEQQLAELADDDSRHAELRAKMLAMYRSQGLEVSEDQIDAGIAARRAQQFTYQPPRGWRAGLAMAWIRRWAIVGAGGIGLAAAATMILSWKMAITWPEERRVTAHLAQLSEGAGQAFLAKTVLGQALTTAHEQLGSSLQAQDAAGYALSRGAIEQLAERGNGLYRQARGEFDRLQADFGPPPTRETYRAEADRYDAKLRAFQASATGVAHMVNRLRAASLEVADLRANGMALQRANEAVVSKKPTGESELNRRELLAKGEKALAEADVGGARGAISGLQQLAVGIESLEQMRASADQTLAVALGTGVAGEDKARVQAAYQRTVEQLRPTSLAAAKAAHADLAAMTETLASEYSFNIVSRDGVPSALGRKSHENPRVKNMYAIVEALDGQGRPAALPLTDELTGKRKSASLFGVRITPERYEAIGADKKPDGVVDDKVLGLKRRGELAPHFNSGVIGGYIVEWAGTN